MAKHPFIIALALTALPLMGSVAHATDAPRSFVMQQQQTITVTGTVVDEKGETIIGAHIRLSSDKSKGAMSDINGNFTLRNVPANGQLEVSYMGYTTKVVPINGQTKLSITLEPDNLLLDEVVVVGYGTQKKVNLTGAVSSVDAKQLEARPVQNVGQALQGMIPGLNLTVNNGGGALDATMSMNIRGAGTIGAGSNAAPLVLIDGTEGSLNALSPNDIENISVLKDASSSAIYGSRAAFGVILITTKSGKEGRSTITYNGNVRFSTATQLPKMMDSEMFALYFNRAAANKGDAQPFSAQVLEAIRKYKAGDPEYQAGTRWISANKQWGMYDNGAYANTDWFAEMYDKNVPSYEHNLAFTGGTEKLNYYISGSILDRKGLVHYGEDKFQRYNFSGKFTAQVKPWLDITYNTRWIREDYTRPSYLTGLFFHNIARRWPMNPVRDPNGYLLAGHESIQLEDGGHDINQRDYLYQQFVFNFKPLDGWFIRLENNYNTTVNNNHWDVLPIYYHGENGEPIATAWDDGKSPGFSSVSESQYKNNYFNGRYYTEYSNIFNDIHDFKVVGGMDIELNKYRSTSIEKKDLITPTIPTINTATNDKPSVSGGYSHWSTVGMFARVNYAYDSRYLLEASIRRDGSSRFIGDKTWGVFPSFSLGWNISNEEFFEPARKYMNNFKLRGSWGSLGNTNISALYPWFQSLPNGTGNSGWLLDGEKMNTSNAPGIVSESLTWERVVSWNIGTDFGFFNNRLQGNFDYFKRTTFDMVGPAEKLSSILGTGQPAVNNTDMESYGWELELRWRDSWKDFNYGIKFLMSDDIQKVTKYYNPTNSLSTWYEGRINGEIWGYTTVGIAQTNEEMNEHLKNNKPAWGDSWAAGDIMYKDFNGDGVVNSGAYTLEDHGDLTIIGNSVPRYKYAFNIDLSWKFIDFSVFLQGVGKRDWYDNSPYTVGANTGLWQSAGFVEHWDFWRPEGDELGANTNAYYPRPLFGSGGKNFYTQTRYLQDASYLRIKNMQLGFTLPSEWTEKAGLKNLRLYTSVDNLYTFTKISKIFDPEATGGSWGPGKIYPLQRTWSVGLNVSF